jgi:hypothetical protein
LSLRKSEALKQKSKPRVRRHACGGQREHDFEKPAEHLIDAQIFAYLLGIS